MDYDAKRNNWINVECLARCHYNYFCIFNNFRNWGENKNAFVIGAIVAFYPSYIFNTGLLLKDAFEICFAILSLLFLIKMLKKPSIINFIVLYLSLICTTHFRFYLGYAAILTFFISWFFLSRVDFQKKIILGVVFVIVMGFIPQLGANRGYLGINSFNQFLNPTVVNFYRQFAYNPKYNRPVSTLSNPLPELTQVGVGSSFVVDRGLLGYAESSTYVLLGPFPWQIKNLRQSLAIFETVPWYLLLFFVVSGTIICFRKRIIEAAPLLIFSIITLVVIAVFDTNFGLIVRIRIPAFISLLCIASFGFTENNIIYRYFKKGYNKRL